MCCVCRACVCVCARVVVCIQLEEAIASFTGELTSGGIHLGDSLESSLELGEKHEFFVTKIKIVS